MGLFGLFLLFPRVSSNTLSLYLCKNVEGVDYLQADFNLKCFDST